MTPSPWLEYLFQCNVAFLPLDTQNEALTTQSTPLSIEIPATSQKSCNMCSLISSFRYFPENLLLRFPPLRPATESPCPRGTLAHHLFPSTFKERRTEKIVLFQSPRIGSSRSMLEIDSARNQTSPGAIASPWGMSSCSSRDLTQIIKISNLGHNCCNTEVDVSTAVPESTQSSTSRLSFLRCGQ